MEIKINIQKNEYVQPTEVRENVVQMIVDAIMKYYMNHSWRIFYVYFSNPIVYLTTTWKTNDLRTTDHGEKVSDDGLRVRGCEMQAAFEVIQEAGYYIYPSGDSSCRQYEFSSKPVHNGWKAQRRDFTMFID